MEPARYSPTRTEVTIEMPASRSDPNSRRKSFLSSSWTRGVPPRASVASKGISAPREWRPNRRIRCKRIAATENEAMTMVRRLQILISVSEKRSRDDTWLIFGCRTVCCSLFIRGVRCILTSFYFEPKLVVSPEWREDKAHLGLILRLVSVWCDAHFFTRFGK